MRRSALSQSNLCRHQKSRWVRCRVVDTSIRLRRDLPHGSVNRIGLARPTNGWRTSRARCDEMSQWAVLVTGTPDTGKTDGVRLLVPLSGEPSWSVTCEKWKDSNSRN